MWRLALIGVRLILVIFVSQAAVLVGAGLVHTGEDSDPLAPYEAIMPGQPVENLEAFSCSWLSWLIEDFEGSGMGVCQTNSDDGHFSSVNVGNDNLAIQSLMFHVMGLSIGDLAAYWGPPVVVNYGGVYYRARWQRGGYQITANMRRSGRFSYWLPVYGLFIEEAQQTDRS